MKNQDSSFDLFLLIFSAVALAILASNYAAALVDEIINWGTYGN